jgi:hypothetical protein
MVVHSCIWSTWEAKAGGFFIQGQPKLYSEFKASLRYIERSYIKENEIFPGMKGGGIKENDGGKWIQL